MLPQIARRNKAVLGVLLGIVILLLGGCSTLGVGATGLRPAVTPTSTTQAGPPGNIPVYPGATLQQQQSAQFNNMTMVSWSYTVTGQNVTVNDVANYYEQQMPANGWVAMQSVPPRNVQGTYGAAVLTYQEQMMSGTPTPGGPMPHRGQRMAIIAIGANNQNNPHQIGLVITQLH